MSERISTMICTCAFTVDFKSIGCVCDCGTVLLAYPAQIAHGFHDNNLREKLAPKLGELGVSHRPHAVGSSCLKIELPDGVCGKKLHI